MMRLLLTSGRGPAECRIALAHLIVRLRKDADALGCPCDIVASRDADGHGPGAALALLGDAATRDIADALAKRWIGGAVWVCRSPLRPHHGRKNWFVAVFELPPTETPAPLDPRDVAFETLRAGGPGGQHQNKTESAVRALHRPSGVSVVVREERSQHRNKALALDRLARMLAAQSDLARSNDEAMIHAKHAALQRGGATRRFVGPDFTPD